MNTRRSIAAAAAASALIAAGAIAPAPASAAVPPKAATSAQAIALVVNARTGVHHRYDRIVIDVKGKLPPTSVKRVTELRYDGSGEKVPLPGRYFLEVKLSPAAAHNDVGKSVYKGPRLVKLNMPKVKGLALTGDFEGVVTVGVAFKERPAYTTMRLHHPERFVLDIRH